MTIQNYIDVFSSLLTPLIAIIMVYIAYQQWRTNHLKVRRELFEERLEVYEAVTELIFIVITQAFANREQILRFREKTIKSLFLFGKEINEYLKIVDDKATKLKQINEKLDRDIERKSKVNNNYQELTNADNELFSWFTEQPDIVKHKFKKYLDLSNK